MLKQYLSYKTGWRHTMFSCILYLLGMYVKGDTITYEKYILECVRRPGSKAIWSKGPN